MTCPDEIEAARPVCTLPIKCSTIKTINKYNWYLIRLMMYIGFVGACRLTYLVMTSSLVNINNVNIYLLGAGEVAIFSGLMWVDWAEHDYGSIVEEAYCSIIKKIPRLECIKD